MSAVAEFRTVGQRSCKRRRIAASAAPVCVGVAGLDVHNNNNIIIIVQSSTLVTITGIVASFTVSMCLCVDTSSERESEPNIRQTVQTAASSILSAGEGHCGCHG